MLRTVYNPHIAPILRGAKTTVVSTPSASVDIGVGDFTVSRTAQGRHALVPVKTSNRAGPVVCTAGADCANGVYCRANATPTVSAWTINAVNTAGTGDDGTIHALGLDWGSPDTTVMQIPQRVLSSAGGARLMGFKVVSNAITEGKKQATLSVASSVYTFTFTNAFARAPIVVASSVETTSGALRVSAATASGFAITSTTEGGVAGDKDFEVLVLGWDREDAQWGRRYALQVPQLKPRLLAFTVTGTGTAAITYGVGDAALTDNGTGDWTLTFTKAFKRAPVCVVMGQTGRCCIKSAVSTTAVTVVGFAGDGTTATDQIFHVFCLGFDSAMEV